MPVRGNKNVRISEVLSLSWWTHSLWCLRNYDHMVLHKFNYYYAPAPRSRSKGQRSTCRGGGIKRWRCLTFVCRIHRA